jgi:hypothetical protein
MKKYLVIVTTFFLLVAALLTHAALHYRHKCKHRFDVAIPIQKELFKEKMAQGPADWMMQQIKADLSSYEKTGITKSMLDQLFRGQQIQTLSLVRFTIVDGHISFSIDEKLLDSRHFRHILGAIQKLSELTPLPNVDFIISLQDCINEEKWGPLFTFAKRKEAQSIILIPDFKALTGYPGLRHDMELGSLKFPWEKKIPQLFWRGATTGGWLTATTWEQIARCKLALLSLQHPQKINAKISGIVQSDPDVPPLIKAKGLLGRTVDQIDHLEYKYLVDVDGNSCSFERYFWALLSNSLVFKQMTLNIQWYYGPLHPYEHFIPVKEDLSDLIEQYQWALDHDEEAKQIAINATEFVKNNLSTEDVFVYMATLLHEYARLQDG